MTKIHIAPPVAKPAERSRTRLADLATFVLTVGACFAGVVVFAAAVAVAISLL